MAAWAKPNMFKHAPEAAAAKSATREREVGRERREKGRGRERQGERGEKKGERD